MSRPHVGNIKRDLAIFALYDTGAYAPKEIVFLMHQRGYTITIKIVRDAVRRRERYPEFYGKQFGHFRSGQSVADVESTA